MPPAPIFERISYRPSLVPFSIVIVIFAANSLSQSDGLQNVQPRSSCLAAIPLQAGEK